MQVCLSCHQSFRSENWRCPQCGHVPSIVEGFFTFHPDSARDANGEAARFLRLKEVEPDSFWFQSRNRLLVWALRRYFTTAKTFLEIGCGTGFVLRGIHQAFPQMSLSGSEALSGILPSARRRLPDALLYQMDARQIPFQEEFDVIGAFDVLEHIADDVQVLSQIFQATRPGGGILITVPQHPFLWSPLDDIAHHQRRYTRKDLLRKVHGAGFEVVRATSFVSLLLPLMAAARIRLRRKGTPNPLEEHSKSRPVRMLLERVMDMERGMIQMGIGLPAGGSLLVVARRATP